MYLVLKKYYGIVANFASSEFRRIINSYSPRTILLWTYIKVLEPSFCISVLGICLGYCAACPLDTRCKLKAHSFYVLCQEGGDSSKIVCRSSLGLSFIARVPLFFISNFFGRITFFAEISAP